MKKIDITMPIKLTSLIVMSIDSFMKKVIINKLHHHRFIFQTPIKEIKLKATINPNKAGYQSPSFLMEGENTAGKLNTTQIKPRMQTTEIKKGLRRITDDSIFYNFLIGSDSFHRV